MIIRKKCGEIVEKKSVTMSGVRTTCCPLTAADAQHCIIASALLFPLWLKLAPLSIIFKKYM